MADVCFSCSVMSAVERMLDKGSVFCERSAQCC